MLPPPTLATYLHTWMRPYQDSPEDTLKGINDALEGRPAPGGFVICATENTTPLGALVMLNTGMTGYIPPNLLLFVAVDPATRGQGIGTRLIEMALEHVDGPIKLHVEADNPARKLYERIGFTTAYFDMRFQGKKPS